MAAIRKQSLVPSSQEDEEEVEYDNCVSLA